MGSVGLEHQQARKGRQRRVIASDGPPLRRRLYRLLDAYRPHAPKRTALCGRVRHGFSVTVAKGADGRASLHGLIRCRSKGCPVCVANRRSRNADLVARTIREWSKANARTAASGDAGSPEAYLLTLTVRHSWGSNIATLGPALRDAWRAVIGGREWHAFRNELQLEYIVAEEITHGANGWHPHLHAILLVPDGLEDVDAVREKLHRRWCAAVARHVGESFVPNEEHGTDLRWCAVGEYVSKLGLELSAPGTKSGKGRSPLDLLREYAEGVGTEREQRMSLLLYRQWAAAMKGVRDITWSRGLRGFRDAAAESLKSEQGEQTPLLAIDGESWDWWRSRADAHDSLLTEVERATGCPAEAVKRLFAQHGRYFSPQKIS